MGRNVLYFIFIKNCKSIVSHPQESSYQTTAPEIGFSGAVLFFNTYQKKTFNSLPCHLLNKCLVG